MADFIKPDGMSDVLWAAVENDFNGENSKRDSLKYMTRENGVTQKDIDDWFLLISDLGLQDSTTSEEVTYEAIHFDADGVYHSRKPSWARKEE